jgi:hypothetical protein
MEVLYLGLPFFSCEKRKKKKEYQKAKEKKEKKFCYDYCCLIGSVRYQ